MISSHSSFFVDFNSEFKLSRCGIALSHLMWILAQLFVWIHLEEMANKLVHDGVATCILFLLSNRLVSLFRGRTHELPLRSALLFDGIDHPNHRKPAWSSCPSVAYAVHHAEKKVTAYNRLK